MSRIEDTGIDMRLQAENQEITFIWRRKLHLFSFLWATGKVQELLPAWAAPEMGKPPTAAVISQTSQMLRPREFCAATSSLDKPWQRMTQMPRPRQALPLWEQRVAITNTTSPKVNRATPRASLQVLTEGALIAGLG